MAKYLVKAHYGPEGARGLLKEGGSSRRDTVAKMAQQIGGSVESFYYAFGETDAYVVVDLPSPEAAAALGLTVSASGAVSLSTVVLLTPEQIDEARNVSLDYRPPGG